MTKSDCTIMHSLVSLGIRACIIWLDVVVLGITWYRTAGIVKAARNANVDTSAVSVLLRDGEPAWLLHTVLNAMTKYCRDHILLVRHSYFGS